MIERGIGMQYIADERAYAVGPTLLEDDGYGYAYPYAWLNLDKCRWFLEREEAQRYLDGRAGNKQDVV